MTGFSVPPSAPPAGVYDPAVAARALPALAPASALGRFDPARSIYNRTGVTEARARLAFAKARAGLAGSIYVMSASLGVGYYGTAGYFSPGVYGPAAVLRARLAAAGIASRGSGWMPVGGQGLADADSRFTYSGAVSTVSYGGYWLQLGAGASITFTATAADAGTAVDAILSNASTGSLGVTVAGTAGPAFNPTGAVTWAKYTAALGIAAGQTVVLTQGASGASFVSLVQTRKAAGLSVSQVGRTGGQSGDFVPTAANTLPGGIVTPGTLGETPDLLLLGLDLLVNDTFNGVPLVTSRANVAAIIASWQAAGAAVALWLPYPPYNGVTLAQWAGIVAAAYQLADVYGVMLLDGTDRTSFANAAALGYLGPDGIHETIQGYNDTGAHWFEALAA